jgi:hypothetical protein
MQPNHARVAEVKRMQAFVVEPTDRSQNHIGARETWAKAKL